MAGLGFSLSVRHDYDRGTAGVASLPPRLTAAMAEGTEEATSLLKEATVGMVVSRTSMSADVARRILESEVVPTPNGARGRVKFTDPPPGGWEIRAKNKKALAFGWPKMGPGPGRGGRWVFRSVKHPGSRPYKLLGRAAGVSETALKEAYDDAVSEVLS
jgi:hypothetical protein